MTNLDLPAIRARAEAATKGPWWYKTADLSLRGGGTDDIWMKQWFSAEVFNMSIEKLSKLQSYKDLHFIIGARQDIPALLAYVEELEECKLELESIKNLEGIRAIIRRFDALQKGNRELREAVKYFKGRFGNILEDIESSRGRDQEAWSGLIERIAKESKQKIQDLLEKHKDPGK